MSILIELICELRIEADNFMDIKGNCLKCIWKNIKD